MYAIPMLIALRAFALQVLLATLIACVALTASPAWGQPRGEVERATIAGDAAAIASSGVPGPLAVFGERAFVIACGNEGKDTLRPVAAGAEWGTGRVIALGHGGMLGPDALAHPGTRAVVARGVAWLSAGPRNDNTSARSDITIGVVKNEAMVGLLKDAGFTAKLLPARWQDALEGLSVVVVDSHSVGEEQREQLTRFVKSGGGLLTSGLAWGWLQLNTGKSTADHPGNKLLIDAGLAFCDGTLKPTADKTFTLGNVSSSLHARTALEMLEAAAAGKTEPLDAQASPTLIAALRVIPRDHDIWRRCAAILESRTVDLVPTAAKPLRSKDGVNRTLLAMQVELDRSRPAREVRAHPASTDFPGPVPQNAACVSRDVAIDLSIPGWHSTGLFAPAGEVITVKVNNATTGLSIRIGCHSDTLWHLEEWPRVPEISRVWPLEKGAPETDVSSALGGLIYIEVPRKLSGTATFTIQHGVESPRFVLGATTPDQWMSLRDAPAPWGELESRKVIVTVPSAVLRTLEDPAAVMEFWDRISDAHATLAQIPLPPERPHRFVADVEISAGYMHSGYPIMTHLDAASDMVSLARLQGGTWGLLHELGHNHQVRDWTFEGTTEVTCNLFSLHAIDTVCTPKPGTRGHGGVDNPPSLANYLKAGAPFDRWKREPFLALHMYVQLEKAFGWETYKKVFAEYRALPESQRPKTDQEKRDQWMVRFSRACGKNLGPFFIAWGVPTTEIARESLSGLPEWMPEDWPAEAPRE
jgi:hypothetical protein